MKILRLKSENIKRLVAVEIIPEGEIVTIAGRNGQGKTSVLDSIWWALAGAGVIQGEPIRKGEDRAKIRLELGEGRQVELIAERKFRRGKSELSITNADGTPTKLSPQAMADSLIGALSFDPLAFWRKKQREQFDELRRIAKIEVDLDELDRLNAADYAKRTDVNREAKQKRAAAAEIQGAAPEMAFVDVDAITAEMLGAAKVNQRIAEKVAQRKKLQETANQLELSAGTHRAEAIRLSALADDEDAQAAGIRTTVAEAPELAAPVDSVEILGRLNAAIDANRVTEVALAAEKRRRSLVDEALRFEGDAERLTVAMEQREARKRHAIEAAELPVEGLGFGEGIVTYNGVPFDQAGAAERWRVCVAIAMAAHPKLRVIRIDEGSLLDSEAMAILAEMAKENDWQVWIEVVSDDAKTGFVIEDGALKEGE